MERIIIRYKGFDIKVNISKDNTMIVDSYQVKSIKDMHNILYIIQNESKDPDMAINKRSIWGMTHEWRAHNLLYALGVEEPRTKHVDLDINQPFYYKIAYSILSLFYPHF